MSDSIRITPGQLSDSLTLRANTALAGCTTVEGDAAGVFIARRWPGLSTGEELLWRVLAWLNGTGDLPPARDLSSGLDRTNFAAVVAATGVSV